MELPLDIQNLTHHTPLDKQAYMHTHQMVISSFTNQ